jgi:hypothetical protein
MAPALFVVLTLFLIAVSVDAFLGSGLKRLPSTRLMGEITTGVQFDTIAREWRLKWSADDNKKSLASVQQTLVLFTQALKKIDGVKSVQRIVCGGCLDYKVIVALDAAKFAAWVSLDFSILKLY